MNTATACTRGHIGNRDPKTGCCILCRREDRLRWHHAHKDKSKAITATWRASNPERTRSTAKAYCLANAEKIKAGKKRWALANMERHLAKKLVWREANRERERAGCRAWRSKNIDYDLVRCRAGAAKRRSLMKGVSGTHTASDIKSIFNSQQGKCAYCKARVGGCYHVDHIIAVSRGGTNERRNLQILCPSCNLSKGSKDPVIFAQSLGMLL